MVFRARAYLGPAHTWFLKLLLSRKLVCACVCWPLGYVLTNTDANGMTWTPYDSFNKFYTL